MKRKFRKWFEARFGYRISAKDIHYLENEMVKAHQAYVRAKVTYEKALTWDNKFNDCLYAWQAALNRKTEISPESVEE